MGHTIKRCKQPIKEEEGGDTGFGGEDAGFGGGGFGNDAGAGFNSGHNDWETGSAAPAVAVGGGGEAW